MVSVSISTSDRVVLLLPVNQNIPAATIAMISSEIFSFPDILLLIEPAQEVNNKAG